ncbi:Signal recognition particle receptor FtsY [hydrothermal vent metagenome]|uniref:Signal recognition particle receptor FtsY n=1 Tax=hydrothermal vent metagenome TaxID=652676 RepID=A0A3B0ZQJ2_9ZZZZ
MFSFKKDKTNKDLSKAKDNAASDVKKPDSWFSRLKNGLSKTRANLTESLSTLVIGQKTINKDLLDDIETELLVADLGVEATQKVIADLTARLSRKELADAESVIETLRSSLANMLEGCAKPLIITNEKPFVILVVGINGAGKTTTIGKLAKTLQQQGKSVMLAAGDTFRAAATEQLQTWGQRNNIPVISQHEGADSASVIYDAVASATAKEVDVLIADTAGRLHTQSNLMEELKKVKRVISKLDKTAPHEVLLVLDAGTGQNALSQATEFGRAVDVSGIALTKLDGTAKGGIIFSIANKLDIPIRYIGVGEGIDDLQEFNVDEFIEALFQRQ